eukprot:5415172-Karenia_brevis.AAC.1
MCIRDRFKTCWSVSLPVARSSARREGSISKRKGKKRTQPPCRSQSRCALQRAARVQCSRKNFKKCLSSNVIASCAKRTSKCCECSVLRRKS